MTVQKQPINLKLVEMERVALISKALSSDVRIDILKELINNELFISEIAEKKYLSMSSACMHVKLLEEAGLIMLTPKPGLRGIKKLCSIVTSGIGIDFYAHTKAPEQTPPQTESMPIGNYSDCTVHPPCGIATEIALLSYEDHPDGFFSTHRNSASLLWLSKGFLEYRFSNRLIKDRNAKQVQLSFEICSEAPGHNNNWPSDICIHINGIRVGGFTSKGDFGDRRGVLNPSWWDAGSTQYGELRRVLITSSGCFIDDKQTSDYTLESLNLASGYNFSLRIGVSENAVNDGGFNLFGKSFGDHPQDIVMRVEYE